MLIYQLLLCVSVGLFKVIHVPGFQGNIQPSALLCYLRLLNSPLALNGNAPLVPIMQGSNPALPYLLGYYNFCNKYIFFSTAKTCHNVTFKITAQRYYFVCLLKRKKKAIALWLCTKNQIVHCVRVYRIMGNAALYTRGVTGDTQRNTVDFICHFQDKKKAALKYQQESTESQLTLFI